MFGMLYDYELTAVTSIELNLYKNMGLFIRSRSIGFRRIDEQYLFHFLVHYRTNV